MMRTLEGLCVFMAFLSLTHTATSIRCLSCVGVTEPIYCRTVRTCPPNNVCGVKQYQTVTGDVIYDVDCISNKMCHVSPGPPTGPGHAPCTECCTTDMCNVRGCGSRDPLTGRGPLCFACSRMTDPGTCQTVEMCRQDQECGLYSEDIQGAIRFSSRCESSFECRLHQSTDESPVIVGRRHTRRQLHRACSFCCTSDFCNRQCGDTTSSVTMTTEMTASISTPRTTSLPAEYSTGMEFIILFLPKAITNNSIYVKEPQVYLTSSLPGVISLEGAGLTVNTGMNLSVPMDTLNFSTSLITKKNYIEHKALYINSSVRTSAFLMNYEKYTTDMSLVLPTRMCGKNYIVPSFEPTEGQSSVIGIASLAYNTHVDFVLNIPSGNISYGGHTYTNGETLYLLLQRLETFTLSHDHDLTGTRITSSKPVCVVAGTTGSRLAGLRGWRSRLQQMVPPVDAFSTEFVIPFLFIRPGTIIRVLSYDQPSYLNITIGLSRQESRHLSTYNYTDINVRNEEIVIVTSTSPVLVTMFVKGYIFSVGAVMMLTPGLDQYLSTYHFAVPDFDFTSYVSIVVPTDQIGGLRLDSRALSPLKQSTVINNGKNFTVLCTSVSVGGHVMDHVAGTDFGLFVYGGKYADGYGYVAGIKF